MKGNVMKYFTESYFRSLIAGVETLVPADKTKLVSYINFDNAATTPPFASVVNDVVSFCPWYSSVHRGTGYKSKLTSDFYENSREEVLNLLNGDKTEQIVIYVKNTTEAINKLSNRVRAFEKRNIVLSTEMEHHSNDLPWREKFEVHYISVDDKGRLSMEDLEHKLKRFRGKVALVTVTGASNVTGYVNNIYDIAALAHKYDTKVMVDGAQLVPHVPVYMGKAGTPEHIDYIAFSAHKMYAPFGTGVLIGPKKVFANGSPDYSGGGTIETVTQNSVIWADPPEKEEAGSPNVLGVVALVSAIRVLKSIGMDNIRSYEGKLMDYAMEKLKSVPDVVFYGDVNTLNRVGIISFNIAGINDAAVANALSELGGIAVRSGCFCAQPYMRKLLKIRDDEIGGMVRISFGIYNTLSEIDKFISMLTYISQNKSSFSNKY